LKWTRTKFSSGAKCRSVAPLPSSIRLQKLSEVLLALASTVSPDFGLDLLFETAVDSHQLISSSAAATKTDVSRR
jgi:hypothetical protein